jgi:hypothetical protein
VFSSVFIFSLNLTEDSFIDTKLEADKIQFRNVFRKEALHLYGIDELSTNEIFDFFKTYKPFAIEWINDSSCNVLWKNEAHSINAMIELSSPYDEIESTKFKSDEILSQKNNRLPPQGCKWRIAIRPLKGHMIYMRFVKNTDRKTKGAESKSQYYVKYGNPNYGNLKGLISNSKRKQMKAQQLNNAYSDLGDEDEDEKGRKLVAYDMEGLDYC